MKLKNVLVVYMRSSLPNHKKTCDLVRHVLKKNKIKAKFMRRRDNMDKEIFMNHDLILVIGGDGSFLRVTHHMTQHIPLLGINSDVKKKEGFFMRANMSDFESKFKKILSGKFRTIELPRLHTIINKKIIDDFALNEIYIGQKKAYKVARFTMKIGKKQEFQKSSGLLVSTGAGSHAWAGSAKGKKRPLTDKYMQYIIREPYHGKLFKHTLLQGFVPHKQKITITSHMNNGIIVVDSLSKEYPFETGTKAVIEVSKSPLKFIEFQ